MKEDFSNRDLRSNRKHFNAAKGHQYEIKEIQMTKYHSKAGVENNSYNKLRVV